METLNQDIKSGNFKRFYLLFGEEEFLKQSYKKRLRQAVAGDDTMNYNYFEGKGLDVRELISLANTMPFFSDRRLIMVEDSGFLRQPRTSWWRLFRTYRIPPVLYLQSQR